ncbi:MAG: T9SS type A sorting domain-containing protein [Flavobacteriia bacterium]|jgi:hypothetical protein
MRTLILGTLLIVNVSFFAQEISSDSLEVSSRFDRVKVIPNPTSEILFIQNGDEISSYQLFNMQGVKVQESKNNPQIISLIDEEIGYYFLIFEINGEFKKYRIQKY